MRSLLVQDYPGDIEIVVVVRADDVATHEAVRSQSHGGGTRVRVKTVGEPGFLAAMRQGLTSARGDVVAFTDDDATYPVHWLSRLVSILLQPGVLGAGGGIREPGRGGRRVDGRHLAHITFSGRYRFGLYDEGPQAPVPVHFLCGANMAYWRRAVAPEMLPDVLQIAGGAPGNESLLAALIRRQGGTVMCDAGLLVDHARAPRVEGSRTDERGDTFARARSRVYVLRHVLSRPGMACAIVRIALLGDAELPGLLRVLLPGRGSSNGAWSQLLLGIRAGLGLPRIDREISSPSPAPPMERSRVL